MIPKSGNRFPACAKPWHRLALSVGASAGEGRSEKIMLKNKSRRNENSTQSHFGLAADQSPAAAKGGRFIRGRLIPGKFIRR
jgi:hypothetical protein